MPKNTVYATLKNNYKQNLYTFIIIHSFFKGWRAGGHGYVRGGDRVQAEGVGPTAAGHLWHPGDYTGMKIITYYYLHKLAYS